MKAVDAILSCLFLSATAVCAQTWTQTTANSGYPWYGVAVSADGTKLAATVAGLPGEGIYLSTNSGATWGTNQAPAGEWGPIASSADGTKLAAANANDYIYTSTNSGATWVQRTNPKAPWAYLASSADGSKLIASPNSGDFIVSTNSGATWFMPTNLNRTWSSVVCSADGTKMAAQYGGDDARPWVSTNCGLTWQPTGPLIDQGGGLAASAAGNILMLDSRGQLFLSTNWGTTWPPNIETPGYNAIVCSADGSTALSFEVGGSLCTSTNFGADWTSSGPSGYSWQSLACSADGKELVAVNAGSEGIWMSQSTPSPQLNLSISGSNLNFSWIVPSTNMVLEESADLVDWTALTNSPSLNLSNLEDQLSLPAGNNAGFFRLISQ